MLINSKRYLHVTSFVVLFKNSADCCVNEQNLWWYVLVDKSKRFSQSCSMSAIKAIVLTNPKGKNRIAFISIFLKNDAKPVIMFWDITIINQLATAEHKLAVSFFNIRQRTIGYSLTVPLMCITDFMWFVLLPKRFILIV